jgi:toxin ParE1/3/4
LLEPRHVSLSPESRRDLRKAYDWYEDQSRGLGTRFLRMFFEAVDLAVERPNSFPSVEADIRRVIVPKFPFGVFFRDLGNEIRVIGVIDLRTDDRKWRERLRPLEPPR